MWTSVQYDFLQVTKQEAFVLSIKWIEYEEVIFFFSSSPNSLHPWGQWLDKALQIGKECIICKLNSYVHPRRYPCSPTYSWIITHRWDQPIFSLKPDVEDFLFFCLAKGRVIKLVNKSENRINSLVHSHNRRPTYFGCCPFYEKQFLKTFDAAVISMLFITSTKKRCVDVE